MRASAVVVLFVAMGLAGCANEGGAPDEEDPFKDLDADVDKDSGIIRGIVVDPSITPIEGATVRLLNSDRNVTTNADGAFVIADLEPGSYFLEVTKPGYSTVQSNAEVKAGVKAPPIVKIQIEALPGSEPRFVPYRWDGYLGCTYRHGGLQGVHSQVAPRGSSCPYVDTLWPEHDFLVDYELDQVPSYATSDLVWESTQHFGGEMSFNLRRTDGNCDTIDVEGTSPLHLSLTPEDIVEHNDRCNTQGGFGPDMPLRVIIFTADLQETRPPPNPATGTWGVGLQIEQDFTAYTHVFYNYAPPENWVFTDDSTVPRPDGS